jgi:ParB family chromosome partitioning protein
MQDSSAFQFLAIDTIHESTTNPRRTFDEAKLRELAESIKHNGLIQPITVRPNNEGFEIVAGARRFRAAQIAELFSIPARIVEIDDAQALEWQLVENSQRVDVHPYEEAQGFQRLLDIPGYDVAALVEKSGKSASHIYARLSLLQLIPTVAEAFTQERITASHANLIARLPQDVQAKAFEQCWRKDWQDKEAAPATRQAPCRVDTGQPLSVSRGCAVRPRRPNPQPHRRSLRHLPPPQRTQHVTLLRRQGDQCLDSSCYHSKVEAFLDREIAAHPGLVQIENGWRNPKEQRPGAVQRGHVREIRNRDRQPRRGTCDAMRRSQDRHRRLRQAAWPQADGLHGQALPGA